MSSNLRLPSPRALNSRYLWESLNSKTLEVSSVFFVMDYGCLVVQGSFGVGKLLYTGSCLGYDLGVSRCGGGRAPERKVSNPLCFFFWGFCTRLRLSVYRVSWRGFGDAKEVVGRSELGASGHGRG